MFVRVISALRVFGPASGALYLSDQLLRRVSSGLAIFAYDLMVQPISKSPILPRSLSKNLDFREIRPGDPDILALQVPPHVLEGRFAQGATCLGAYNNGELIGYGWFVPVAYQEDEVRCTYLVPKDATFDFDLFVFPTRRMGIGFAAIWHGLNERLGKAHFNASYSRISRFNLTSRRSHMRLGSQRIGSAIFFKAWALQLMFATLRPFFWVSFTRAPRLLLAYASNATGTRRRPALR